MTDPKLFNQNAYRESWQIQQEASSLGFDWPTIDGVFDKVAEELNEIRAAWASGDREHAKRELGDLMFVTVNLARHLGADPHEELNGANRRFAERFNLVKAEVAALGKTIDSCTIAELDTIWAQVKQTLSTSHKK